MDMSQFVMLVKPGEDFSFIYLIFTSIILISTIINLIKMSISRKQALAELKNMFPTYDKNALNTLLRANGKALYFLSRNSLLINWYRQHA